MLGAVELTPVQYVGAVVIIAIIVRAFVWAAREIRSAPWAADDWTEGEPFRPYNQEEEEDQ